jgi:hypothetical protein
LGYNGGVAWKKKAFVKKKIGNDTNKDTIITAIGRNTIAEDAS